MKKVLGLLLCVLLIAFFSFSASAEVASAMIQLSRSPEMNPGDTITLTAVFSKSIEVSALSVELSFDSTAIEIKSGDWLLANAPIKNFNLQERAGILAYAPAETVNGRFFEFTLKIKEDAAFGSYNVSFRTVVKDGENADVPCNLFSTTLVVKCNHDWNTAWTTDDNSHWYDCKICTEKKDMSAHIFDNICDTLCCECGFSRNTEHTYSSNWMFGADSHWYECTSCGNKKDESSHMYDDECDEICNECSAVRTTAHIPAESWTQGETTHWRVCTVCNDKIGEEVHTYDNNCDTTCNGCGKTRETNHSYSSEWKSGADSHWYECTFCGNKKDEVVHVYDNVCDAFCNTCSSVRIPSHSPVDDWLQNENHHWRVCGLCNEKVVEETHIFNNNCDSECNVCKKARVITHSYSTKWTTNKTKHWHICTACGDKTDETVHIPQNVVNSKYLKSVANCISKAVYYKSCLVCGETLNETFESGENNPNVHTGNEEFKEAVEATCKHPGNTGDKYCKDCQTKLADGERVLAGHKLKKVEKVQSTCINEGNIEYYRCEGNCGMLFEDAEGEREITDSKSILLEKASHTVSVVNRIEPTLQKNGMERHFKCDVCGKAFEDSEGKKEITDLSALVIEKKTSNVIQEKSEKKINLFIVVVASAFLVSSLVAIPIIIKYKR